MVRRQISALKTVGSSPIQVVPLVLCPLQCFSFSYMACFSFLKMHSVYYCYFISRGCASSLINGRISVSVSLGVGNYLFCQFRGSCTYTYSYGEQGVERRQGSDVYTQGLLKALDIRALSKSRDEQSFWHNYLVCNLPESKDRSMILRPVCTLPSSLPSFPSFCRVRDM